MNSRKFSEAMSELGDKYIEEALHYKKKSKKSLWLKLGAIAACLAVATAIGNIFVPFHDGLSVSVFACGTDEEITNAGVIMSSGTISDTGEMKGLPLMFYLSGKDIASVRFSCKNEQLNFMDWTEKRDEYGNAQNFTVAYGEDESEYYYLTIDWVPNTLIRELTDHKDSKIATLPEEMRHDIIVMEITFANGKTATKEITISLLDDGTFLAASGDCEIDETYAFVNRPDSQAIPREILYRQGAIADVAPMVYVNDTLYKQSTSQTSYDERKEDFVYLGMIESDVTHLQGAGSGDTSDGVPRENFQANHPIVGAGVYQYGGDVVVEIAGKYWLYEAVDNGNSEEQTGLSEEEKMLLDPSYGTGVDGNSDENPDEHTSPSDDQISQGKIPGQGTDVEETQLVSRLEEIARAYYAETVFEVVSMELKSQNLEEAVFSVCVSKGGVVQEPDRTITLQQSNGAWEVVNEGY